MSISYSVIPAEPETEGFQEWFQSAGIDIPYEKGRFPTFDELIGVLKMFQGSPILQDNYQGLVDLWLGQPEDPEYAQILGSIQEDGLFHFRFDGWRNKDMTMVKILKGLSEFCGPLVLWEEHAATPLLITKATDLEYAIQDWNNRIHQRYNR